MFKSMRAQDSKEEQPRSKESTAKREIVVLSILLHLLLLACWNMALQLDWVRLVPAATPGPSRPPLVFDLQQPDMPREVIATPADARTRAAPRKADFLSDKNALARNQEPAPGLPVTGDPFSRGDLASHELPPEPTAPFPETEPLEQPEAEKGRERERAETEARPDGERTQPLAKEPTVAARKPLQLDLPRVPHQQLQGRAAEDGGLSFNTYNWDFAPYMLALKQRIGRNIFPPLAFSKLGMIDGNTLLRFKIYPDGRLADLQLLDYSGHHSLMETSRFAVTTSAPFPNLPTNVPEPYLEVTARFSYFIKR